MSNPSYSYFLGVGGKKKYVINQMWDKPILLLEQSKLSSIEIEKYLFLAECWQTCICCCLDKQIKKRFNGSPVDQELESYGTKFAQLWDIALQNSNTHKYIAGRLKDIIERIEFRCAKILFSDDKSGYLDIQTELNIKNNRYYAVIKSKYLKVRKSNGAIELLDPEMKAYADGFKTIQEANELIAKYYDQFNLGEKIRDLPIFIDVVKKRGKTLSQTVQWKIQ